MQHRRTITFLTLITLVALVAIVSPSALALAQDGLRSEIPSWADASRAPRHRSQADWLLDAGWQTAEELFSAIETPDYAIGDRERFIPLGSVSGVSVPFVLRYRSEHAYFWFESRLRVDTKALHAAGDFFDQHIWPRNHALYGNVELPTLAGDGQIHILHQRDLWSGVMGAFNPDDQCPRKVCPESNQRAILYVSLDLSPLGSDDYLSTLAHEHQHMMQHAVDGNESRWLNEGLSQLAEQLNGFDPELFAGSSLVEFLTDPDLSLGGWSFAPAEVGRHYGASYLFAVYLYERFGLEFMHALVHAEDDGLSAVENLLRDWGESGGVDAVFADWIVANLLDDPDIADGWYGYQTLDLPSEIRPRSLIRAGAISTAADLVQQYGADYLVLNTPGRYRLHFQGSEDAALLDTAPASADWMWWSNTYNSSAARLTGAFDLTRLTVATLEFSAWWDVEEDYDWFQVLVSESDGQHWTVVGGEQGQSGGGAKAPGVYYSGYSSRWRREAIDLSAYAGRRVLIRFEYLTDASENLPGVALDDFAIRELNYHDDVEDAHSVWQPEGFLRVPRAMPQHWTVALIQQRRGGGTAVARLPINASSAGTINVVITPDRPLILAIGAMAAFSETPATYDLRVERLD